MDEQPEDLWHWLADQMQRRQVLSDATVHLFCAPEDLELVEAWVRRQPSAHLYRVRCNPFVPPRVAYAFQADGVLAPATVRPVVWAP